MDYLVQQGWIYHDINDDGLMKKGEDIVITDFGGCTKRKMAEDGEVTFLPERMGTAFTFSSWEMSQVDGEFEEDKRAFTRLGPTSVPAVQLSHLSWFSLMRYADICHPNFSAKIGDTGFTDHPGPDDGNHLCVAAKRLFLERYQGYTRKEREFKEIKERRQEFYKKMVSDKVKEDLADTLEWEYFQSLRPYISYQGADDQYWEKQIKESTEQTWNKYKKDFVGLKERTAETRFEGLKERIEAEEALALERLERERRQRQNRRKEQSCGPRCLIM